MAYAYYYLSQCRIPDSRCNVQAFTMDNLTQARVELARLEAKAQELVKQLLDVRAAVSAQRSKISQLLRQASPPIHRLPTELLLPIFEFDISAHPDCERKQDLAGVSRRWRDVILNSPIFWTIINIPRLDPSCINAHLKRSGESLLDIAITVRGHGQLDYECLAPYLDIVTPHAHRWRSLHVFDVGVPDAIFGGMILPVGMFIVEAIDHLQFPSLKRVIIPSFGGIEYPDFLTPTCAPALEHLDLGEVLLYENFAPPSTLKTLRLTLDEFDEVHYPSFAYIIPTQSLTTLSLSGDIADWILRPNSIQFPVLSTLTLSVGPTNELLQAIIAPNLEYFNYDPYYEDHPLSFAFEDLEDKFNSVNHFSFLRTARFHGAPDSGILSVCKTFPNVHHAELRLQELSDLFPDRSSDAVSTHIRYPVDLWKDLQSLTLRGPSSVWVKGIDHLSEWLMRRQKLDLPPFRIKLTDFGRHSGSSVFLDHFERLHECLGNYSSLEFDIPITKKINLSRVGDPSFRMVSVFPTAAESILLPLNSSIFRS